MRRKVLLGALAAFGLAFAQGFVEVYGGGRLWAQGTLEAPFQASFQGEATAVLHLQGEAYAFLLAEGGRTLGEVRVWVNGRKETLVRVAQELQLALEGRKDLALFQDAQGRVVGLVEVNPKAKVEASGSTRVVLIVNGEPRVLEVRHAGKTLAEIQVEVGGKAQGLLEVAFGQGAPGQDKETGVEAKGGVRIGIGLGVGGR